MKKDSIIYWAGFFDGEGHIELHYIPSLLQNLQYGRGHYQFQIWLDQRLNDPEEYFAELLTHFGGGIIHHYHRPGSYRWYNGSIRGRNFLEAILPYIRIQKRLGELAIEFQKSMQRTIDDRLLSVPDSEIEIRDKILEEYGLLFKGTKSKRVMRLGRDYINQPFNYSTKNT